VKRNARIGNFENSSESETLKPFICPLNGNMTYLNCKLRLLALFVAAPSCSCFSFLSLRHTNCVLLFHFTLYSEFTSTDHDPLYKPAVKWAETLGSSLNTTVEIKVIFILLAGSGIYSSDILQLHSKRSNVGLFTQSLVAPQS